jgi:hypothetical protein
MEIKLFEKNSPVKNSIIYQSYLILKQIKKSRNDRVSIYNLFNIIKSSNPECNPKQIFFGLMILYSTGIINLDAPYIVLNKTGSTNV